MNKREKAEKILDVLMSGSFERFEKGMLQDHIHGDDAIELAENDPEQELTGTEIHEKCRENLLVKIECVFAEVTKSDMAPCSC